jgi:hypothetical protein
MTLFGGQSPLCELAYGRKPIETRLKFVPFWDFAKSLRRN